MSINLRISGFVKLSQSIKNIHENFNETFLHASQKIIFAIICVSALPSSIKLQNPNLNFIRLLMKRQRKYSNFRFHSKDNELRLRNKS